MPRQTLEAQTTDTIKEEIERNNSGVKKKKCSNNKTIKSISLTTNPLTIKETRHKMMQQLLNSVLSNDESRFKKKKTIWSASYTKKTDTHL